MFESLELRRHLSATLANGILEIVGTDGNDQILLNNIDSGTPGRMQDLVDVRLNGVRQSFQVADITKIVIATGDGDDSVKSSFDARNVIVFPVEDGSEADGIVVGTWTAHASQPQTTLPEISIDAGTGQDAIQGGPTDQTIRGGEGRDTIFGGAGNDVIRAGIGNDVIFSFGGRDDLIGEGGIDTIICKNGRYRVDNFAEDLVTYSNSFVTNFEGQRLEDLTVRVWDDQQSIIDIQ